MSSAHVGLEHERPRQVWIGHTRFRILTSNREATFCVILTSAESAAFLSSLSWEQTQ